jgi:hypothetical protein
VPSGGGNRVGQLLVEERHAVGGVLGFAESEAQRIVTALARFGDILEDQSTGCARQVATPT